MTKELVHKANLKREKGYLYYVDKNGDVSRALMARGKNKGKTNPPELVLKLGITKENGYLYYVDRDGNVGRAKMAHRSKRVQ